MYSILLILIKNRTYRGILNRKLDPSIKVCLSRKKKKKKIAKFAIPREMNTDEN